MISLILAKKILSLFLILAMGIVLVKTKVLKPEDSRTISTICLYLVMPCVILSSYQIAYTDDIRDGLLLALGTAVLIHIGLLVINAFLGKILKMDAVEKVSVIYSNAGNLIVPIVTSLLGKEWVIYSSAFVSVQQILIWSHGKMVLCGERKPEIKKILTNVNMISIFLGIITFLLGIQFPTVIQDTLDTTSAMVGPAAMIVTGMLIGGMDLKKVFGYRRVWLISAVRLLFYPLIAVVFLKFSGLAGLVVNGETILLISLLGTITPPASSVTQMALVYGKDADYASAICVVSTLLCIITMPLMVMIYQM